MQGKPISLCKTKEHQEGQQVKLQTTAEVCPCRVLDLFAGEHRRADLGNQLRAIWTGDPALPEGV